MTYDPLSPEGDPLGPPAIPTEVHCLHCGQEYESYLIEWRIKICSDGKQRGFWSCPIPGCDGVGFGCDLLPTDPDYQDEHGGWVHLDDDEDGEDWDEAEDDLPEDLEMGGDTERPGGDIDEQLPW
jgi:hypothetical protein